MLKKSASGVHRRAVPYSVRREHQCQRTTGEELLNNPHFSSTLRRTILELPTLHITDGSWERAGLLRAKVIKIGRRAKLADTLIAQSCLDHHATLVTRDRDFKSFISLAGLRVAFLLV